MSSKTSLSRLILYSCLFFSGVSGLIYEVAWAKYLSVLFGNTTYAYTVVLFTFMGGMALGSFSLGRLADRVRDRLTMYAVVEIGIAFFCMSTPFLFFLSRDVYLAAARRFPPNSAEMTLLMCGIGAFIMLVPTMLMGGTIPILGAHISTPHSSRGKLVARLYYINSFGAVAGTIAAGYYLIRHFGLGLTVVMAALVNLLVGAVVVIIRICSGRMKSGSRVNGGEERSGEEAGTGWAYRSTFVKIALCTICLSGFTAMLYELVWVRLLSLVLGSSTYSFSVMLTAFISGVTLGSFLIHRHMPGERTAFVSFGLCEACIGMLVIFSIPFYERLPYIFLRFSDVFAKRPETFMLYETVKLCVSSLVMLPPTIFLGMTIPLASIIASRSREQFGGNVGGVLALNTTGNIMGALATGLALIPLLGLRRSLELGIAINLGLGIFIFCTDRASSVKSKIAFSLLCCAAFASYRTLVPDWNKAHFTAQIFRGVSDSEAPSLASLVAQRKVLYHRDGLNASVSVVRDPEQIVLFVNGKADASTGADMPTQVLLAGIPLVLKPSAKDVMVIGLGGGVTCGTALLFPVRNLDVVELSPEVAEASAYFARENHDALKDPRLRLHIEDARTFIQRTEKKYDLIISEPSNPWMSGVGDLYSIEHFSDCLRALREGGIMAQWVHTYEMDDDTFKIIVKTFCSVFPDVSVWTLGKGDALLLGARDGLKPDFDGSKEIMASPAVGENLGRLAVKDLFTLLCLQMGSDENVRRSVQSERLVNRDYTPLLEYRAPIALYTGSRVETYLKHLDERRFRPEKYGLLIGAYTGTRGITDDNLKNLFNYLKENRSQYSAYLSLPVLYRLHRQIPSDGEVSLEYASSILAPLQEYILQLEKDIRDGRRDSEFLDLYASYQFKRYLALRSFLTPEIFSDTMEKLKLCAGMADRKAKIYQLMGKVCLHNRDYQEALSYYRASRELCESARTGAP